MQFSTSSHHTAALPMLSSTTLSSPGRGDRNIAYGCYVSPIFKRPIVADDLSGSPVSTTSPTSTLPSLSGSHQSRSSPPLVGSVTRQQHEERTDGGRFASPNGYNKPKAIDTKISTVRRMFHHASPADRKAFYGAFLDRPAKQGNPTTSLI
jgi:hypothetical protein